MSIAARIEKLRRMAEHPRSNPNEAAVARAELERLEREHPASGRFVAAEVSATFEGADFDELLRAFGADPAAFARRMAERRARQAGGILDPGDSGYNDWARRRTVGETLAVEGTDSGAWWEPGRRTVARTVTIARVTASQYVMDDGTRFRRTGRHPGYRVGEDGRSGRTYLRAMGNQTKRSTPP